ncbi:MAG: UDP-3-O-(3-hydroxymyristoyl)glucosamine N-acyltransferase [Flavobacteriales bacterium]|nr:UDP-3-O-(3-hydroxymyristoyl)glucosamine N-acyltransferase [Flavobacteriales bacterium]MCB9446900.1 UDP-3-O-(3-hydroxymyristoyl)glucosamine N-acyltransferase [Flavobacteriales bacterium]
MKFKQALSLTELVEITGARLVTKTDTQATGINEIHMVNEGDITYVDHPKYYASCLASAATFILIDKETECPEGKALLICKDPFEAYNSLVRKFSSSHLQDAMIHPDTVIGEGTFIAPGVYIGEHVTIGKHCHIHPHVCIYPHTTIGDYVVIHANTVIGSDPFYYKKRPTGYDKMLPCGSTRIDDHVEIGAGCTVDRGVSGETSIGAGTKIDNLVQIGHDTRIGKNCLFAAQVGISGVVTIGDHVTLWGQVGIPSKLTIGDHAVVLGQSGLTKSVKGHATYFGSPAEEATQKMREIASLRQLPDIVKKFGKK